MDLDSIAETYKIPTTSVQVLAAEFEGSTFYEACALRSKGLSLDRVVEFVSAVDEPVMVYNNLVSRHADPNEVIEAYLVGLDSDRRDPDAVLNPVGVLNDGVVVAQAYVPELPSRVAQELGSGYRDDPLKGSHVYEHLASRRE